MRPRSLHSYVGQSHILGAGKPLRRAIEEGNLHSMVLWGPPGTGKTTLARMLAEQTRAEFITLSAVTMTPQTLETCFALHSQPAWIQPFA